MPVPSPSAKSLLLAFALAFPACRDDRGPGQNAALTGPAAASSSSSPASSQSVSQSLAPPSSASSSAAEPAQEIDPNRVAAEPSRRTLRSVADEPALYAHRDLVADRYGVVQLPLPLEVQEVPLPHARRALLFTGQGAALDKPVILVVGADNTLFWSKERPLVGTRERAREITLSRGPHGEVLVFWYDEPTHILAAREWTHEGNIFADYVLLSAEGCDGLSALYWPGRGWVTALALGNTVRAQLLGENGTHVWPDDGLEIRLSAGVGPSGPAPAATPAARPRIAVLPGDLVEITAGPRKVQISPEGKLRK